MKKGPWSPEEMLLLKEMVKKHGEGLYTVEHINMGVGLVQMWVGQRLFFKNITEV